MEQSGVQSLARAFGLLELLSRHPQGMLLQDISDGCGLHKSTAHRLLSSLIALGYVKKTEGAGVQYRLTLKLAEMAGRVLGGLDVQEAARPVLERLCREAGEAVHLAVRDSNDIVYIQKWDGYAGAFQMSSRIGVRRPLYCTALGKSILSTLSDREIARVWEESDIVAYTEHTVVQLERLYRELDGVREGGFALDNEENEPGVRCIAAPVRDYTGQCKAAFSVSAPTIRMTDARMEELAPLVKAAAREISAELGCPDVGNG